MIEPLSPPAFGPQPPMRPYVVYEIATGRIVYACVGTRSGLRVGEGQAVLQTDARPDRHFVRDGVVMLRMPLDIEVDGRTIRGLPAGTHIYGSNLALTGVEGEWTAGPDLAPLLTVTIDAPEHIVRTVDLRDYRADRIDAYGDLGDQIGAMAKAFAAMRDAGVPLPAETLAWLAKIDAVKAANPKD